MHIIKETTTTTTTTESIQHTTWNKRRFSFSFICRNHSSFCATSVACFFFLLGNHHHHNHQSNSAHPTSISAVVAAAAAPPPAFATTTTTTTTKTIRKRTLPFVPSRQHDDDDQKQYRTVLLLSISSIHHDETDIKQEFKGLLGSESKAEQQDQEQEKGGQQTTTTGSYYASNNKVIVGHGQSSSSSKTSNKQSKEDHDADDDDDDKNNNNHVALSLEDARAELLDLLPSMTGQAHEYRRVETLVNTLESQYEPIQTLEFLNLMQQGEWQLLFSTNLVNRPFVSPLVFRMRELYHVMECNQLVGNLTARVVWDLAEDNKNNNNNNNDVGTITTTTTPCFDCTGLFVVKSSYEILQGSRVAMTLQQHILQPKGQRLPQDCQGVVGYLYRVLPTQVFDPSHHSIDTTYLDGNLKIWRYTGPQYEGVRDIWIRRNALEINPTR